LAKDLALKIDAGFLRACPLLVERAATASFEMTLLAKHFSRATLFLSIPGGLFQELPAAAAWLMDSIYIRS
jgi:hypothetical protein